MIDWSALSGDPFAPLVGPFPHAPFLETWWDHHRSGDLAIVGSPRGAAAVVLAEGVLRLAGDDHLTDYHSPLGSDADSVVGPLLDCGVPIVLDSLPAEAADPLEKAFVDAGAATVRTSDEACLVLDLEIPGDDGWESVLRSKQRHEVRRKRRRFQAELGEPALELDHAAFGTFVDLHRAAVGDKGEFMTKPMAAFFESLLGLDSARLHVLHTGTGATVAAAFGFEDDDGYYLYNSAFDPATAEASPGIVLVDALVRSAASAGRGRFDFLKGSETYKRRLGAVERPLFTLHVTP